MEMADEASTRPAPARRRLSRDDRRAQLLAAAVGLAARRDLDRIPIADVAAAAGVSEGLVFHYFPTKAALVRAVVEDAAASLVADLRADRPGSTLDRLTAGLDAYLDHVERRASSWRVLLGSSDDPVVTETLARVEEATLAVTFDVLDIPAPSPVLRAAAQGFLAYERAVCLAWIDGQGAVTREQIAALLTGTFLGPLPAGATDPAGARAGARLAGQ
ncbi:TetR/AcrR family transcriptional regulator [Frankia sp. CNm7]|nr:TetR/AcrR family transcriptional regulator [Frankia nepalensis]